MPEPVPPLPRRIPGRRTRAARLLGLLAAGALTMGAAYDPGPGHSTLTPGPQPGQLTPGSQAGQLTPGPQTGQLTPGPQTGQGQETGPAEGRSAISPFTGLMSQLGPVLAVKFDNAIQARPHHHLDKADIVYVEKVEGGLSRLMGVYSSQIPESLGPVRSARESDVQLLQQFGRPALAYSGVRSSLDQYLKNSPLHVRSFDALPGAYFRAGDRQPPHNLFVRPAEVLRSAPQASPPTDIGFRFGNAPTGGTPTAERTVSYSSASHTFRWSPTAKRWYVSFDGEPARQSDGRQMNARTIVIQHVAMPPSKYHDVNGAATPYIKTVGQGRATVLRDGRAFDTSWKRPSANGGTSFRLRNGELMPFAPGQVWVVYADQ